MSPIKPLARNSNIIVQEIEKEVLVYDLLSNKAFSLNETSTFIWQSCDGKQDISEIALHLSKKFNTPINENFIWLGLHQLKKENLLDDNEEISLGLNGLSRREIVRKIGFASMISLPVVSSLVAPTIAHAQSCTSAATRRPLGCPCTTISQCQPPGSRCCSNVPGSPRVCVEKGAQSPGQPCGVDCDCNSGVCLITVPRICQ